MSGRLQTTENRETQPTAVLVVVVQVAVPIRDDTLVTQRGACRCGPRRLREALAVRVGGHVVIVDAFSAGVDARESTVVGVAAREELGTDTGALAAIATVVTCYVC